MWAYGCGTMCIGCGGMGMLSAPECSTAAGGGMGVMITGCAAACFSSCGNWGGTGRAAACGIGCGCGGGEGSGCGPCSFGVSINSPPTAWPEAVSLERHFAASLEGTAAWVTAAAADITAAAADLTAAMRSSPVPFAAPSMLGERVVQPPSPGPKNGAVPA